LIVMGYHFSVRIARFGLGKGKIYQVLPYDLYGVISVCLRMKMGIGCLYMFMKNSRFSQKKAEKLADKYNKKCSR
jgi:hypothetical protein